MKKTLRKNKAYYTRIYRLAKACDTSFDFALQMIKLRADDKRLTRKKKEHCPHLIIVPPSLVFNWKVEIEKISSRIINEIKCSFKYSAQIPSPD